MAHNILYYIQLFEYFETFSFLTASCVANVQKRETVKVTFNFLTYRVIVLFDLFNKLLVTQIFILL